MSYRQNDRDANEREIIDLLVRVGCVVIQMDRHKGFDLLVICPRTGNHVVEVKNPAYKWKLTDAEKKLQASIEAIGRKYEIIETIEDAAALVDI